VLGEVSSIGEGSRNGSPFDNGYKIQQGKFGHDVYMVIRTAKAKRNRLSYPAVP
jgi:hypothetical protein